MTKNMTLPHRRQLALYAQEYKETGLQKSTNSSIYLFRQTFSKASNIYSVLVIICLFEMTSRLLQDNAVGYSWQIARYLQSSSIMVAALTLSGFSYYLFLMLGHGYQSKDVQLYVDKFSSKKECYSNLTLMQNFYLLAVVGAVVTIAVNFFTSEPIGSLHNQFNALKNFLEITFVIGGTKGEYNLSGYYNHQLVVFNWLVYFLMLVVVLINMIGFIQVLLIKSKYLLASDIK